jgi:hypothetical protein
MKRYTALLACLVPVVLCLAVLGQAGCSGGSAQPTAPQVSGPPTAPATGPSAPDTQPGGTAATPSGWTLDVKQMRFPDGPVAGRLGGQPFKIDRAELKNNGVLSLSEGTEFLPDAEVSVFLFLPKGESAAGKTFAITPEAGPNSPHVHARGRSGPGGVPDVQMFMNGYAMKLELDQEKEGKLSGKIYLCLPDKHKSQIAGSFLAELEPDYTKPPAPADAPYIVGKITLKGQQEYNLVAGFVGATADGSPASNLAGTPVKPGTPTQVTCTTFKPQLTTLVNDEQAGCSCRHVKMKPGTYLVYVRSGDRYLDWHWVEVKDGAQRTLEFTIDTATTGSLEVTLPAQVTGKLDLVPLDGEGKLPDLKTAVTWLSGLVKTDVPVKDGKVLLDGLRPGRYRVQLGKAHQDVTVKAGETVKSDLSAAR